MADLTPAFPTANVSLSTSGSGQVGSGGLTSLGGAEIVKLPDKLQAISRAVVLGGQVTGQNPDGTVNLKTAVGEIVIKPATPLPPGQQTITIQIQPGAPPLLGALYAPPHMAGNVAMGNTPLQAVNMQLAAAIKDPVPTQQKLAEGAVVTANVLPRDNPGASAAAQNSSASQAAQTNLPAGAAGSAVARAQSQSAQPDGDVEMTLPGKTFPQNSASAAGVSLSPKVLETMQQTMTAIDQQGATAKAQKLSLQTQFLQNPSAPLMPAPLGTETLPPGGQLIVRIMQAGVQMEGEAAQNSAAATTAVQTGSAPAPAANAVLLQGKIVSTVTLPDMTAQTIVETPMGRLALPGGTFLPQGAPILLEWMKPPQMQAAEKIAALKNTLLPLNMTEGKSWPALETLLETLQAQNSVMTPHLLNAMPKLNGDLPQTMLLFLVSLRSGDIKHWLGENGAGESAEEMLAKAGKDSALGVLSSDFSSLKGMKAAAQGGEWKLYPMPLLNDQGLQMMQLAVRDHYEPFEDEQGNTQDTRVTRFLVDVEFSAFGPVQLDGFMREKNLDIIARTQTAMPQEMRRDLTELYSDTLGSQGMNGTLSFQAGNQNWIKLMQKKGHSNYSA